MSDIVVITFVVYNPCIVLPKGLKPISKRYVRLLHSDIYIYIIGQLDRMAFAPHMQQLAAPDGFQFGAPVWW